MPSIDIFETLKTNRDSRRMLSIIQVIFSALGNLNLQIAVIFYKLQITVGTIQGEFKENAENGKLVFSDQRYCFKESKMSKFEGMFTPNSQ